jgi:hypothetical protein
MTRACTACVAIVLLAAAMIAGGGMAYELSASTQHAGADKTSGTSDHSSPPAGSDLIPASHGSWWTCGHPISGNCYEPNGTAGCEDNDCCDAVCKVMESCCTNEWDQDCADLAVDLCPPPCPGEGSCFEPQEDVGCEDKSCCEQICMLDSFCCSLRWDPLCAAHAVALCGIPACTLPALPGAPEPEECPERINDGCNLVEAAFTPITCSQQFRGTAFAGAPRDTDWYHFQNTQQRTIEWIVTAEFPVQLLIMRGGGYDGCGWLEVVARGHGGNCQPASVAICAEPGTYYLFVSPGTPDAVLRGGARCPPDDDDPDGDEPPPTFYGIEYHVQLMCSDCTPLNPADLNGDGVVDVLDLLILLDSWGTCPVGVPCPADFDQDGAVDVLDLLFLLDHWG